MTPVSLIMLMHISIDRHCYYTHIIRSCFWNTQNGYFQFNIFTQNYLSLKNGRGKDDRSLDWSCLFIIRPTCRDVLWYGAGVCPSVRLSVCPSVHKACKHDTDWTVPARTFKLGTLTTYDKRRNPIDFQGQGSKVKVTRNTLLFHRVNTIQTEPFQLGPSNLVH